MRGDVARKLGLAIGIVLVLVTILVVPAPAAPITATVPYSAVAVADTDLDGNPATGDWSGNATWTIPLENGAVSPYGSAKLIAKHDGSYVYFRIDGKIDVSWVSSTGNHFWLGVAFTSSVTSHHSSWQDGVFFGEDAYTTAPPLVAVDTHGGGQPPTKDTTQNDLGRMAASGSSAPYNFTAEWKRKLNTGDTNDLTFVADGATSYYFYATTDSNGGGSGGGRIGHRATTNDNVIRFAPVFGDTTPPVVALTSPANGAVVNGIVTLAATATDNVGVTKVEFYADTTLLGTGTTAPYSQSWDTTPYSLGSHTLTARAYDAAGNAANSTVTVTVDRTARSVTITAPLNGTILKGAVTINASASGSGGVARVEFRVDGVLLGSDSTSPYSLIWNTTASPEGLRNVTAEAYFSAGGTLNASVWITVDRTPPQAEAGPARNIPAGTAIAFDGSGSRDANGIANWTWTFVDAGARSLYGATPSYRFANAGVFPVNLTVADPAGNSAQGRTWVNVTVPDTTPPGRLGRPNVTALGPGQLSVSWTRSAAPDLAGYLVFRSTLESGPYIQMNAKTLQATTYLDSGLESGGTYFYEIVAVDLSGNPSTPSPSASGTVVQSLAPLDLMSLRWVVVPVVAGLTMTFLALLGWRESRRRRSPPPPPEATPPSPPEVGP